MRASLGKLALAVMLVFAVSAPEVRAQAQANPQGVQLDFTDVELSVVIDTIAQLTGKNFIYDDKVRGRVTVISPAAMSVDQAYAVFESVLQVKGFTTVSGPGGVIKIIPIRDAKESSVETVRGRQPSPNRDQFVTRLIPLQNIDAEAITNTLKPLVSKEASMVAYAATNTIILTDSAANIRRLLGILDAIDIETYKEELAVIAIRHADASTMAQQLSEIYGAETSTTSTPTARSRRTSSRRASTAAADAGGEPGQRGRVRILTDDRTNSLIVLASRGRLQDIRTMIGRLDIPVTGGGRIHVHYLNYADAEELAATLTSLVSGAPQVSAGGTPGQRAEALRAAVTELSEGVTITADAATNSLVIQASQEGYRTLSTVINKLDIPRPQVLVEALIMEVQISDNDELGFSGLVRLVNGSNRDDGSIRPTDITFQTASDGAVVGDAGPTGSAGDAIPSFVANVVRQTFMTDPTTGAITTAGSLIQGVINASQTDSDTNIISSPHILTSDNEEAEIRIGDNIPIITSRVESAAGQTGSTDLASSVNVERQEIGVTLRVTPQITEGDTLRLEIFQEITDLNPIIQGSVGALSEVGPALSNRRVENTVSVADGETVVIGGLVSDDFEDSITKVPWLGDIPFLGWLFKTQTRNLTKKNLLIFLTPHIVRRPEDLEHESIRKREEFRQRSTEALELTSKELKEDEQRREEAASLGLPYEKIRGRNPTRGRVMEHEKRYPLERMREIEELRAAAHASAQKAQQAAAGAPDYHVLAAVYGTEAAAATTLTQLLDGGFDGTIVSGQSDGAIFFRVVVGPFKTLNDAQDTSAVIRSAFGLSPSVLVGEFAP